MSNLLGVNVTFLLCDASLTFMGFFKFSVASHGQSLCPVEWEIIPSSEWSASISVVRFTSSKTWPLRCTFSKDLGSEVIQSKCESPDELRLALCRAQVSALFPELCYRLLHTASKEDLRSGLLLSALSLRRCLGAVRICIRLPVYLHHPINIVDLPGAFKRLRSCYSTILHLYQG